MAWMSTWAIMVLAAFPTFSLIICPLVLIYQRIQGTPEQVAPAEKGSAPGAAAEAGEADVESAAAPPKPAEPAAGTPAADDFVPRHGPG